MTPAGSPAPKVVQVVVGRLPAGGQLLLLWPHQDHLDAGTVSAPGKTSAATPRYVAFYEFGRFRQLCEQTHGDAGVLHHRSSPEAS